MRHIRGFLTFLNGRCIKGLILIRAGKQMPDTLTASSLEAEASNHEH